MITAVDNCNMRSFGHHVLSVRRSSGKDVTDVTSDRGLYVNILADCRGGAISPTLPI